VLARWLIPPTGFLPSRCPTPRWRCFNRHFLPHCSPKFRKDIFSTFFPTFHIPGGLHHGVWYLLGLSGEDWPATSLLVRGLPLLPASQDPSPHAPAAPASPHPVATLFSSTH
jgi:hypothetical protein